MRRAALLAGLMLAIASPAVAGTPVPQCTSTGSTTILCSGVVPVDLAGNALDWATLLRNLPGGGAITAGDGDIVGIGRLANPAAGSTNYRLGQILAALGLLYQSGGAVPLAPGAATSARQDALFAQNASFGKRTTLVAATDYSSAAFRAIEVTCSASATVSLTLIGETGSSSIGLAGGGTTYQIAYSLKSIDSIPNGCVLKGLQ